MASGSVRVAQSIENGLPAQRRKEKQQRLKIMAMGDIQVAEEHLKFGRTNDAQSTLDNMSPETAVVAKRCAQYWIQRVQVRLFFLLSVVCFPRTLFSFPLLLFFLFFFWALDLTFSSCSSPYFRLLFFFCMCIQTD